MTSEAQRTATPAEVLRRARKNDSQRKRAAVIKTIRAMTREGVPITFASVAQRAKVSKWLVYADGMRECVEAARAQQLTEPDRAARRNHVASTMSLQTDLELCRQDNRNLRAEIDRLKNILREQLGEVMEQQSSATLKARVDELIDRNRELSIDNSRLSDSANDATAKVVALEQDLVAVRTRLKQMMRLGNDT